MESLIHRVSALAEEARAFMNAHPDTPHLHEIKEAYHGVREMIDSLQAHQDNPDQYLHQLDHEERKLAQLLADAKKPVPVRRDAWSVLLELVGVHSSPYTEPKRRNKNITNFGNKIITVSIRMVIVLLPSFGNKTITTVVVIKILPTLACTFRNTFITTSRTTFTTKICQ